MRYRRLGIPFAQAWVYYPDQLHMGFTTWDDFFVSEKVSAPLLHPFINVAITHRVATTTGDGRVPAQR